MCQVPLDILLDAITMPDFDALASNFDQYRDWPASVREAIRAAVWRATESSQAARILDLGAGTGRIGRAFVTAGNRYIGIDSSLEMLRQFQRQAGQSSSRTPILVQALGEQLPFPDATIDVVLLMHVLSAAGNWGRLLQDACRVARPGGAVIVGQASGSETGVDARMKGQMAMILSALGHAEDSPRRRQENSLKSLEAASARCSRVVATTWEVERSPRMFLERHRTGHRFAKLPITVQNEVLAQLGAWAESAFGSIDRMSQELYRFELLLFVLRGEG
ncbi:MAG TPA: class I SAM-dependent methyltransferase [Bryobacteraceae bacterium]